MRQRANFHLGANCSPHAGRSIRSKSIRSTSAGGVNFPHFGHTVSSEASTLSRLTLFARGNGAALRVSPLELCRPERADIGVYCPIFLLGHRTIVHDDEVSTTVFAGRTSCMNHPEDRSSRNIVFLFAVRADEHGAGRGASRKQSANVFR
jgi:hypothetical protein